MSAGLSVTDTLPAGTTFQPSTDCTAALQVVTCSRSLTLGVGGTTSFTVHVTVGAAVADGTILDNSAHVSSTGTVEGNTANNDSLTTHTTVQARANIANLKLDTPDPVVAGTTLTYTLTITNNGPSNAVNATVYDSLWSTSRTRACATPMPPTA